MILFKKFFLILTSIASIQIKVRKLIVRKYLLSTVYVPGTVLCFNHYKNSFEKSHTINYSEEKQHSFLSLLF